MKKILAVILLLSMLTSVTATAQSMDTPFPQGENLQGDMPFPEDGGSFGGPTVELPAFLQLTEVTQTAVWSYAPAELGASTLTSVFIVLPDQHYISEQEAMNYLSETGFIALANEEKAGVILMNSLSDNYSEADIDTYEAILDAVAGTNDGGEHTNLGYTTMLTQVYMIGEGSGATFINNYMTQHCDVLAAVVTFGGEIADVQPYAALPAYIVSGSSKAEDFYKTINHVNTEEKQDGKTVYYNNEYSTEKIIVSTAESNKIDAEIVRDAYYSLLRRTNRSSLATPVWFGGWRKATENAPLTLMDRPIAEELGLVFNGPCSDSSIPDQSAWYEWIPEEALSAENSDVYPLVLVYHGAGDDPVFEAEQNGWVQLAGEQRFIVVAPEDNNADGVALFGPPEENATQRNIDTLQYVIDKYPVDTSRIYLVGFSLGGVNTIITAESNLDIFAAIAPCAYPPMETIIGNNIDATLKYEGYGYDPASIDLPVFYFSGTSDSSILPTDENGAYHFSRDTARFFNQVFKLNEIDAYIDPDTLDFDTYPWYGFDVSFNQDLCFTNKHGQEINTVSYYNTSNYEMLRMMIMTNGQHNHYTEIARYVWDYVSHFSRNADDGKIVYSE